MDVVKRNVEEMRGQVNVFSEAGKGSVFKLVLPLTMALIDGMVVRVGDERFIIPILSVMESVRAENGMVHSLAGKMEIITLRNRQLPFYRLSQIFSIDNATRDIADGLVVVVENTGRQIGLMVDDLVGIQQTVIKSLGSGMGSTDGLSGGAIMADGRIGLILDVAGVFKIVDKIHPDLRKNSTFN